MKQPHISDWKLELLALGKLQAEEQQALLAQIEHDPALQARYQEIQESNPALLRDYPAEQVATEVARRLRVHQMGQARPARPAWLEALLTPQGWAMVAVAACLLALGLTLLPDATQDPYEGPPGFRVKGEPTLLVHRIQGEVATRLSDENVARQGDTLQLSVAGAQGRYVVVLSVDGNAHVTLHYPLAGDGGLQASDTPFSLPHSYRLDDAPRFERFFLITSQAPLDPQALLEQARRAAPGLEAAPLEDLPEQARQSSFLLKKTR